MAALGALAQRLADLVHDGGDDVLDREADHVAVCVVSVEEIDDRRNELAGNLPLDMERVLYEDEDFDGTIH